MYDVFALTLSELLMNLYRELLSRFGPRHWWPAETPFEVCVGAVLTQNTSWKNVTSAIANLQRSQVLDPARMYQLPLDDLARLIRPAGYFNVKARRLKNLVSHIIERHGGSLSQMLSLPQNFLRQELLAVNGIGKETADSIILYAAQKPVFVVDAYTKRVLQRHQIIPATADYDFIQGLFNANLVTDVALFNDFHAQFVAVGHHYCKKKPACTECPLQPFLQWKEHVQDL